MRCRGRQQVAARRKGFAPSAWTSRTGCCEHSRRLDQESGDVGAGGAGPRRRPALRAATFDLVATSYGALPFVADADQVMAEVARVLRPGGPCRRSR